MLSLLFIDYGVEPFYYENGGPDLYEDGANYGMASLLHIAGPTLLGTHSFDEMMSAFQLAVKEKSPQAIQRLLEASRATNWQELPEIMGPLAQFRAPECISAIITPGVETDIAIVVLQSLISRMEVMEDRPYRIEHDRSKNLTRYSELIQRYIAHKADIEFKATDIASLKFPLKLVEVAQVDSKKSPAVQIADVLIGAAIEAANNISGQGSSGLNPDTLLKLYKDDQFISLFPSVDFEGQRRFRRGNQTSKMIDYVAEHILRSR